MKWFNNLKISAKIMLGILIVVVISAIVGLIAILNLVAIKNADTKLYEKDTLAVQNVGDAAVSFMQMRYFILKESTLTDPAELASNWASIDEFKASADKSISRLRQMQLSSDEASNLIDTIVSESDSYFKSLATFKVYIETNQKTQADEFIVNTLAPLGSALRDDYLQLMDIITTEAGKTAADNASEAMKTIYLMISIVAVTIIISIVLGRAISSSIANPIKKIETVAKMLAVGDIEIEKVLNNKDLLLKNQKDEIGGLAAAFHDLVETTKKQINSIKKIAEGDLTAEIEIRSEFDVLGQTLQNLVNNLNKLVATIMTSSEQVASGSNMVSHSSISLSSGTTQQASAIEELSASVEEISSQTVQNAQNADKVNTLTRSAKEYAAKGDRHMKEMLGAITDINTSSNKINKIIKVIDDIAFQTNILALNAAVEAARAGQYGRGFSVVAEEVRSLASRAANAAKETTDLIDGSLGSVASGTKIANETAQALGQIVTEIELAADLVSSISIASKEQVIGIEQINSGILQVSQVIQTNAATAEESAAASEELSAQAEQLRLTVNEFKVKGSAQVRNSIEKSDSVMHARPLPAGRDLFSENKARPELSLNKSGFEKY